MEPATREVFGNIAPWMQAAFYALMAASLALLGWRLAQRARLWHRGRPGELATDWRIWLGRLALYALAQRRVHRRSLGGVLHLLLFSGFVVLTIGTTLLMIAHAGPVNFHVGRYYLAYELTMDVFGVAFCVGCLLALYRQTFRRPRSLGHAIGDWWLLGTLLAIGVTGFLLEALRIKYTAVPPGHGQWSPVGDFLQRAVLRGMRVETAQGLHLFAWWVHAVLVAGFLATLPLSRMLHAVVGPLSIATRPARAMGALEVIELAEVERTGRIGAAAIEDFHRQQLLSLDACMECGRCEDACPAWAAGKPLSPKQVVLDLRARLDALRPGSASADSVSRGPLLAPETLWACTMCQACVSECPVLIGHVDLISDCRRSLVAEGRLAGAPAVALRHLGGRANPFGEASAERMAWADGLPIRTVAAGGPCGLLLWVGCAGALDPRARKVTRATARLLLEAGVDFAVLGPEEQCTGDPARRLGDELLFQQLAQRNIERLNGYGVKQIVTPCPHCFNTLRNEYPQLGGNFAVQHHAQLLADLVDRGQLRPAPAEGGPITLHDPCYLARVHGEVDAQRRLLVGGRPDRRTGAGEDRPPRVDLREMPRSGCRTFCCGAGGGRMWFDEPPEQRVSHQRGQEVLATGATRLATACPFCLNMMTDALTALDSGQQVQVLDVAELLAQAIGS